VININGQKITSEYVVQFLGLYFEGDLKWNHQVEATGQKCIKPIISYIRTTWMGADPTILLRLYTALIRPHIEYGGFPFHSLTKGQMDLLEKIQCKAIRLTFGHTRMTLKNVVLAEAKIPPITFRLKFLGSNYLTRALSNTDHLVIFVINGKGLRTLYEITRRKGAFDLHLLHRHRTGCPSDSKGRQTSRMQLSLSNHVG
jgi:hypothetical protein